MFGLIIYLIIIYLIIYMFQYRQSMFSDVINIKDDVNDKESVNRTVEK